METARNLITKMLSFPDDACTFAFQGGEPTLRGVDFFRAFVETVQVLNTRNKKISYAIQTNGLAINAEWAQFFHDNDFLVGLSVDGTESQHDSVRLDHNGQPTLHRVLQGAAILEQFQVAYNVLCVIHARNAKNPDRLYRFFRENGFGYWQFIPCLAPIGTGVDDVAEGGDRDGLKEKTGCSIKYGAVFNEPSLALQPDRYAFFLKALFDKWYADFQKNIFVSIRMFDNILDMLLGFPPENCAMKGRCSVNLTVEADGSIFPCDFYALDEWLLGNINTDSINDLLHTARAKQFASRTAQSATCASCKYFALCRGGCPRESDPKSGDAFDVAGEPFFCSAMIAFYDYTLDRFMKVAQTLRQYHNNRNR